MRPVRSWEEMVRNEEAMAGISEVLKIFPALHGLGVDRSIARGSAEA